MLLSPLAAAFGAAAARRMGRPAHYRAPVPVICVGNLVVGGAGKTPAALALAALARSEGLRPGFVATGYGGSASAPTLVERDAPAELVGDEALMLAAAAPTVVAADRAAAAVRLIGEGVAVIIMDDGFQNPRLAKDLSLVVVDAAAGIGNGRVMPAGPLRAPLDAQIARADALIVIGGETASHPSLGAVIRAGGPPVVRAHLKPVRVEGWRTRPILAYAGIGRPEKFFASLAAIDAPVAATRGFADHHPFSEAEARLLLDEAKSGGYRLVTTEKDRARMSGATGAVAELLAASDAFAVELHVDDPGALADILAPVWRKAREGRA
ncbi:MAG TPA: tetraacyldisaccharide 4'-kinase [Bauldia sp.]|nr:tetraacyldisaccharide 4'-kinase [Bauldia sp.]